MFLKPFGTSAGLTLMIPLAEFGKSSSASMEDTTEGARPVPEDEDTLSAALDHKKSSFAAELSLGVVFGF